MSDQLRDLEWYRYPPVSMSLFHLFYQFQQLAWLGTQYCFSSLHLEAVRNLSYFQTYLAHAAAQIIGHLLHLILSVCALISVEIYLNITHLVTMEFLLHHYLVIHALALHRFIFSHDLALHRFIFSHDLRFLTQCTGDPKSTAAVIWPLMNTTKTHAMLYSSVLDL